MFKVFFCFEQKKTQDATYFHFCWYFAGSIQNFNPQKLFSALNLVDLVLTKLNFDVKKYFEFSGIKTTMPESILEHSIGPDCQMQFRSCRQKRKKKKQKQKQKKQIIDF